MLNKLNKKVIRLAETVGITADELISIDQDCETDDDEQKWWFIAHRLVRMIGLPDEEVWLDALKDISIDNIDDVITCIEWHLNEENLESFRNQ